MGELQLVVGSQLEIVRSQVCRSQGEVLATGEHLPCRNSHVGTCGALRYVAYADGFVSSTVSLISQGTPLPAAPARTSCRHPAWAERLSVPRTSFLATGSLARLIARLPEIRVR